MEVAGSANWQHPWCVDTSGPSRIPSSLTTCFSLEYRSVCERMGESPCILLLCPMVLGCVYFTEKILTVKWGFKSFFPKGCDVLVEPHHFVQEPRIAGFAIIW